MNPPRWTAGLLAVAILAACSSPAPAADDGAADPIAPAGTAGDGEAEGGDTGSGGGGTSISLTLTGGPDDGTHTADAPSDSCSRNAGTANTFGLQYSTDGTDGLTSHQLLIRDAAAAASGGTDDFMTDITVNGNNYSVDTGAGVMNEPEGSGTVTLDDRGDTASITIEGETAEGVGISAEIECDSVFG